MPISSKIIDEKFGNLSGSFLYTINTWILFGIIALIYLMLTYASDQYIFRDEIYLRSYSNQLNRQSVEAFLDVQDQYRWSGYLFHPFILLFKIAYTGICINIGAALSTIEFKFKTIFKAVLPAEFVFIPAQILYLVNLSFHLDSLTFESAANYYPLTVLGFFGAENVVSWFAISLSNVKRF